MNLWHGIGVLLRPSKKAVFYLLSRVYRSTRPRVAIVVGENILLVQNWGDSTWALPGGGAHRHEDLVIAAQREVKEELGIILSVSNLQYIETFKLKYFDAPLYVARIGKKPPIRAQKLEITAYQWAPLDLSAPKLKISRSTSVLIAAVRAQIATK